MRWGHFRRSENVEDYRNPVKPVENRPSWFMTLMEMLGLTKSKLAHDAGSDDIKAG